MIWLFAKQGFCPLCLVNFLNAWFYPKTLTHLSLSLIYWLICELNHAMILKQITMKSHLLLSRNVSTIKVTQNVQS